MSCDLPARPPLQGESHLTRTSLPSVYDLNKFVCAWDVSAGVYWWYAPLKTGSVNPIYGGLSGNATAEVGQGWWLTPPKYFDVTDRKWSSHSFVATRVPAFNHTSCCCQIMSADMDQKRLWLTEYCTAIVEGLEKSARDTCAPYAATGGCPTDNASALLREWPIKPYSESYSICLDPLGTSLPKPQWLHSEESIEHLSIMHDGYLSGWLSMSRFLLAVGMILMLAAVVTIAKCFSEAKPIDGAYLALGNDNGGKTVV